MDLVIFWENIYDQVKETVGIDKALARDIMNLVKGLERGFIAQDKESLDLIDFEAYEGGKELVKSVEGLTYSIVKYLDYNR